jgi:hypothetical protein
MKVKRIDAFMFSKNDDAGCRGNFVMTAKKCTLFNIMGIFNDFNASASTQRGAVNARVLFQEKAIAHRR